MEYTIIAVYRKNHQRHLSVEEMRLARAVVLAVGEHAAFITNDIEEIRVHQATIEAASSDKAMRLYKEIHHGCEVISCEPIGEGVVL